MNPIHSTEWKWSQQANFLYAAIKKFDDCSEDVLLPSHHNEFTYTLTKVRLMGSQKCRVQAQKEKINPKNSICYSDSFKNSCVVLN